MTAEQLSNETSPIEDTPVSFAKDAGTLASGTLISYLLLIIISPILTRLYGPDGYGLNALFISISGIIGIVVCLRYESSIVLPQSGKYAANILGLCIIIASIFSVIITPVIIIFSQPIANVLGTPGLSRYLILLPVAVFVGGLTLSFTYWNTRMRRFGNISKSRAVNSLVTLSIPLTTGFLGYVEGGGLIIGWLCGNICGFLILAWNTWRNDYEFIWKSISIRGMKAALKEYARFPIFDTWASLISIASAQLPILLLAFYFTQKEVGYYSLAISLLYLPVNLIGAAIGQVFFQRSAKLRFNDALPGLVEGVFSRLMRLGLLPLLMVIVVGPELFSLAFGSEWAESGVYAQILSPWLICVFMTSPLIGIFSVLGKLRENMFFNIILFLVRIISLVIGGFFGSPILALVLFSLSSLAVITGQGFWIFRLSNSSPRRAFVNTSPFIEYCLAIFIAGALLSVLASNYLFPLVFSVVGIAVYYIILARKDDTLRSMLIRIPGLRFIL